ncbi:hypothetical protein Y032_0034g2958 [Ancylostoma ceylanicum]|uniref:Uncharacterized protein n=1 Tax=Ancylostoma ceylanicum TaxID=53326 RepID=A0A016UME0_9BILA|nr:hypothetical protein Y032_0034g2958 [Ancylostoma ceylanicum]
MIFKAEQSESYHRCEGLCCPVNRRLFATVAPASRVELALLALSLFSSLLLYFLRILHRCLLRVIKLSMLSGVRRAVLESVAQCRALSTTALTKTYDPRCIRAEGFDPNKRIGHMKNVDPAFLSAGMFVRQPKPYEVQSEGFRFDNNDTSRKHSSNILLDVLAQRSSDQMVDTFSDYQERP